MKETRKLIERLRDGGRRLTQPRRLILEVLEKSSLPLTAADVHMALRQQQNSVDLVTVYRNLATLRTMGLVIQVELQEGQSRYEVRHGREHHHHIRCRGCGRIVDLMLCPLKNLVALIEKKTRYTVEDHALEFFGLCPKCR